MTQQHNLSIGRVKWSRDDGTGYIEAGGIIFYFDRSSLGSAPVPGAGTAVYFHPELVLDRWCASHVTTQGLLQR